MNMFLSLISKVHNYIFSILDPIAICLTTLLVQELSKLFHRPTLYCSTSQFCTICKFRYLKYETYSGSIMYIMKRIGPSCNLYCTPIITFKQLRLCHLKLHLFQSQSLIHAHSLLPLPYDFTQHCFMWYFINLFKIQGILHERVHLNPSCHI